MCAKSFWQKILTMAESTSIKLYRSRRHRLKVSQHHIDVSVEIFRFLFGLIDAKKMHFNCVRNVKRNFWLSLKKLICPFAKKVIFLRAVILTIYFYRQSTCEFLELFILAFCDIIKWRMLVVNHMNYNPENFFWWNCQYIQRRKLNKFLKNLKTW